MALVTEIRTDPPPATTPTTEAVIAPAAERPLATLAWLLGQALISAPLFP